MNKKYMLICVCDREINTPRFFETHESAHDAMVADIAESNGVSVEELKELLFVEDDDSGTCITDNAAWTEGRYHSDMDWKIFNLEDYWC